MQPSAVALIGVQNDVFVDQRAGSLLLLSRRERECVERAS
jgi:hypothetical protein